MLWVYSRIDVDMLDGRKREAEGRFVVDSGHAYFLGGTNPIAATL